MADHGQYTINCDDSNDFDMDDSFAREALFRALDYGIAYHLYREAFQTTDASDRTGEECANVLGVIVNAALWGAANAKHVLMQRQVEESCDDMGESEHGEGEE